MIYIMSSCIHRSDYPYQANVEMETSLDPVVNRSALLSDLIALSAGDTKMMAPLLSLKNHQEIFILREKLTSKLSLQALNVHLLLSREMPEVVDQ